MAKDNIPLTDEELVDFWTAEFIDWEKRKHGENHFFENVDNILKYAFEGNKDSLFLLNQLIQSNYTK